MYYLEDLIEEAMLKEAAALELLAESDFLYKLAAAKAEEELAEEEEEEPEEEDLEEEEEKRAFRGLDLLRALKLRLLGRLAPDVETFAEALGRRAVRRMSPEELRELGMKEIARIVKPPRIIERESWWKRYGIPIGVGLGGLGAGLGSMALLDLASRSP